ncbi:unnamed protein product, partial [marine sediment metagenome]
IIKRGCYSLSRSKITLLVYDEGESYVIEMDTRIHRYASLELLLRDIKLLFNNTSKQRKNGEPDEN